MANLRSASDEEVQKMLAAAWEVRERSYVIGPTKVGCAVLSSDGQVFTGCNVEHRFRSHDVHAEVNAIGSMVAAGGKTLRVVAIAAERDRFTPCGACMDWIMQFSDGDCLVVAQAKPGGAVQTFTARELMPYYPL